MPKTSDFLENVLKLLAPLGDVRPKSMFGGFGIFLDDSMFALITKNDELFLKADDLNRPSFEEIGLKPYGRMPYYAAPVDSLKDWTEIKLWAEGAVKASSRAKSGKAGAKKTSGS